MAGQQRQNRRTRGKNERIGKIIGDNIVKNATDLHQKKGDFD
jgi:hypothetical protein